MSVWVGVFQRLERMLGEACYVGVGGFSMVNGVVCIGGAREKNYSSKEYHMNAPFIPAINILNMHFVQTSWIG